MFPALSPSIMMRTSTHRWSNSSSLSATLKLTIQRPPFLLASSSQSGRTPVLNME